MPFTVYPTPYFVAVRSRVSHILPVFFADIVYNTEVFF